jgi:DNA ligase (NAD+)
MDIDGFGRAYVERFYEIGQLRDIADVYNLDYSEIQKLEGFGVKSVQKLQAAIEKAKKNPLSKLLHSLSVHHLGKKASQLIAQQISSIYDLVDWDEEQYTSIKDIGPVVAQNVQAYFSQPEHIEMIKRMEAYGVNISQTEDDKPVEVADDAPLKDKTILFTGSLQEMTRNEAKQMAILSGAKPLSAVSSKLDFLVVGEKAGSKLKKAQDLGTVTIWTEKEFLERINQS